MGETQPMARVKLVRADNAKVNGITIEIEGNPEELGAIYEKALARFEQAVEDMRKTDPQNQGK